MVGCFYFFVLILPKCFINVFPTFYTSRSRPFLLIAKPAYTSYIFCKDSTFVEIYTDSFILQYLVSLLKSCRIPYNKRCTLIRHIVIQLFICLQVKEWNWLCYVERDSFEVPESCYSCWCSNSSVGFLCSFFALKAIIMGCRDWDWDTACCSKRFNVKARIELNRTKKDCCTII